MTPRRDGRGPMRAEARAAVRQKPRLQPGAWLLRHVQTLVYTLGQMSRAPLATLMTAAVIGIALALPTGLYVLLNNVQQVSSGWDGASRISVFLKMEVSDERALSLAGDLRQRADVEQVRLITRAEALAEYRDRSGLGDVLDAFGDENPLPAVLVIAPGPEHTAAATMTGLVKELGDLPEVEIAQLDLEWLQRLQAITHIVRRGVLLLGALLALAVLLIVGNTIRLGVQNRRDEIEIAKLFGATDAFIRRPFLYTGLWYGVLGGGLAWLLVSGCLALLQGPVSRLAAAYEGNFALSNLGLEGSAALFASAALLGLIGSWISVASRLHAIEPS